MITWNGFSLNNGGSTLIPKDPHYPPINYSGFIFGINEDYSGTLFDPWFNAIKAYTGSYIVTPEPLQPPYPIPDSYYAIFPNGINSVYLSDEAWSATSANPSGLNYNRQIYCLDKLPDNSIYEIRQFDFWHQKEFMQGVPLVPDTGTKPIVASAKLPTDPAMFKRGEKLTRFDLRPIKYTEYADWSVSEGHPEIKTRTWFGGSGNNIEPFITAIKAACPRVSGRGSLRYNCSPDYDHCCTAYPDWY